MSQNKYNYERLMTVQIRLAKAKLAKLIIRCNCPFVIKTFVDTVCVYAKTPNSMEVFSSWEEGCIEAGI
jgi:molybdopterin-guanine dinucleotide biosynthesis protein A